MEVTYSALIGALVLVIVAVATSSAIPTGDATLDERDMAEKRPKYMDTREDFDVLKQTVYLALNELIEEGKVSPSVLTQVQNKGVEKRRYMGICMRPFHNHFIPYPCMRDAS